MSVPRHVIELALKLASMRKQRIRPGLASEALREFERRCGIRVPEQLADWLLFTNGRLIGGDILLAAIGKLTKDDFDIESVYGYCPFWRENGWIPVADDSCGDTYLILTKVASCLPNPVVFTDHETDMTKIAYAVASDLWHLLEALFKCEIFTDEVTATWSVAALQQKDSPEFWWPLDEEKILEFDPDLAYVPLTPPWQAD